MSGDDEDLTRLEDLSEFLHEDDPETDKLLKDEEELPEVPEPTLADDGIVEMPSTPEAEPEQDDAFSDIEEESDASEEISSEFFNEATNPDIEVPDVPTSNTEDELPAEEEDNTFGESTDFEDDNAFGDSTDFEDDNAFGDSTEAEAESETEDDNTFGESTDFEDDNSFGDSTESESEVEDDNTFGESTDFEDDNSFGDSADAETEGDSLEVEVEVEEDNTFEELPSNLEPSTTPPKETPVPRENFSDVKDFGNSISYGVVSHGGNPPFSIILRDIKFHDDADDIIILMKEHGLCPDSDEQSLREMMESGSLLISQISEYSAIYLAHKMRRFDCNILVGLSDQLHPSKSYSHDSKGLVSKYNLKQNISEELVIKEKKVAMESILAVTTPTIEGHKIVKYLDLLTSHSVVEDVDLQSLKKSTKLLEDQSEEEFLDILLKDSSVQEESKYEFGINDTYKELVSQLQAMAYKIEANAIVGINFQISPLVQKESDDTTSILYKITCSGNGVIVDEL